MQLRMRIGLAFVAYLLISVLGFAAPIASANEKFALKIPFYCVDDAVLDIFSSRVQCMRGQDLGFLGLGRSLSSSPQAQSWEELSRVQELIAYDWFVLTKDNPFRRPCSDPAVKLEYIPFLPLHPVSGKKGAAHEIGGVKNASFACSYSALVSDIERYVATRDKTDHVRKRFAVSGTLNLRTQMGVLGMTSQERKGAQYDTMTSFVTSTFLGHYERFPQCPDLLRKHWRGVLELPYVVENYPSRSRSQSTSSSASASASAIDREKGVERDVPFLFVGRMWLFGPERVCSVRNTIAALSKSDAFLGRLIVVNTTSAASASRVGLSDSLQAPPSASVVNLYSRSVFCIVAKGDSYSTAALYAAVDGGCIPVIISDWLAPAANWAVPWAAMSVRVSEEDFLSSPTKALQAVQDTYGPQADALRREGRRWRLLLSYGKLNAQLPALVALREDVSFYKLPDPGPGTVVPALEMFLYELLYHPGTNQTSAPTTPAASGEGSRESPDPAVTGLSCETPYHCPMPQFLVRPMKVEALGPKGAGDERSFLCKHVHRLIGQYKMVFNQKCVRILWPLRPGFFKPFDEKHLSAEEKDFVTRFHRQGFSEAVYPYSAEALAASEIGKGVVPLSAL